MSDKNRNFHNTQRGRTYYGEQESLDVLDRPTTRSIRRYRSTLDESQPQQVHITVDRVPTRAGRTQQVIITPGDGRRERNTGDDKAIHPLVVHRRQPMQEEELQQAPTRRNHRTSETQRLSRRGFSRMLLIGGATLAVGCAGLAAGSWGTSLYVQSQNQQVEGQVPSAPPIYIEAGHHDDSTHKTELRAYLDPQADRVIFLEIPGGDYSQNPSAWKLPTLTSIGYTGDLSQVFIRITAQPVGDGHYQVIVTLTCGGVGIFQKPIVRNYVFFDDEKNHRFSPVVK